MSHKIIKFGMLALVALALTYCQREDAPEAPQQDPVPTVDPQAVVSLNEAKSLFEASENQKRTANSVSRSKRPLIELETDWRYFEQTQTLVGDAYSKIPVTIVGSDLSAEMLFLKEDGVTEPYLFITEPDSLTQDNRIVNADFYLFTPKGEFISAYGMKEGVITHELVPKYKGRYRLVVNAEAAQAGKSDDGGHILKMECDCDTEYFDDDCECIKKGGGGGPKPIPLDEVTVYGKRKKRIDNSHTPYPSYTPYTPNNNNGFPNPDSRGSYHPYKGIEGSHKGGSSSVGAGLMRSDGTKVEEKVDDDLTNPCAKAVLEQAKTLNSEISNILGMFGSDDNYNIRIHNKSFAMDSEHKGDVAYTIPKGSISGNVHTLDCDIYLNDDIISSASQEYILATIYHEVIHSYLIYELQTLGEKAFNRKYPSVYSKEFFVGNRKQKKMYVLIDDKQHHNKFSNFIESLAQSIMSFPGTQISLETARAMAKVGVVENESLSERENYLNNQQKLGKSGIPCKP